MIESIFVQTFIKMSIVRFISQNEKYSIERELLIKRSKYFSTHKSGPDQGVREEMINIISEFELAPKIQKATINKFIEYFRTGKIELNEDNIFTLKFLSTKYEISKLQEEYVKNEYKKLIDLILTNMNDIDEEKEQLLSKHILQIFE